MAPAVGRSWWSSRPSQQSGCPHGVITLTLPGTLRQTGRQACLLHASDSVCPRLRSFPSDLHRSAVTRLSCSHRACTGLPPKLRSAHHSSPHQPLPATQTPFNLHSRPWPRPPQTPAASSLSPYREWLGPSRFCIAPRLHLWAKSLPIKASDQAGVIRERLDQLPSRRTRPELHLYASQTLLARVSWVVQNSSRKQGGLRGSATRKSTTAFEAGAFHGQAAGKA